MHILRAIVILLLTGHVLLLSCKTEGPQTPEDAFKYLKDAYQRSNAGDIVSILSKGSIDKVKKIIKMISLMDERQLRSLAERFGVTVDKLKNLSVNDYMTLQLTIGKKVRSDTISEIIKYKVVGIDTINNKATVRVENGMELIFVKEDKFWKFDMKEL